MRVRLILPLLLATMPPFLRGVAALMLCSLLIACSGIPVSSMPRLLALQSELLTANPPEFMLAVQTDARMAPPPGAVPLLSISIRPREAGSFDPVERQLPMRLTVTTTPAGLPRAGSGRRWLVYSLGTDAQAELARLQARFKQLQAERQGKSGGSLAVGIAQDGLAADDPQLQHTRWESWLQTASRSGFFELWSGTLADLKAHGH